MNKRFLLITSICVYLKGYLRDWKFLVCLCSFYIGFLLAFYTSVPKYLFLIHPRDNHFNHGISFDVSVFLRILLRNTLVSFLLSVISFLGFGVLSPAILLLNGMYLGMKLNFHGVKFKNVYVFFIFHGPIEIISFAMFGAIGLTGISFYRKFFKSGWYLARADIPQFKEFIFPFILLFLAAFIESFLIVNY